MGIAFDRDKVWLKVFVASLNGSASASLAVERDEDVDPYPAAVVNRAAAIADEAITWIDTIGMAPATGQPDGGELPLK